ncbi:MAG: ribonuclease III [Spirochaetaceae bacterium]|nr:ribonuclease III [Spirochaetaceae bacterium]
MFKNISNLFTKNLQPDSQRKKQLLSFSKEISVHFNDLVLLDMAFHHRSATNEVASNGIRYNNERLEFLGDAVLGMATASYLYETMVGVPEGELARIKSVVVSEMTLAPIALDMGIDRYLVLGKGEELSGGRRKKAILADAVEAVIGAYYLDSGYQAAEKLVLHLIVPEIDKVLAKRHHKDYKTMLQEFYQKKYKTCPVYEQIKCTGPDHDRTFWVSARLGNVSYGPATGKSKKEAEQAAARIAWEAIGEE